MPAGEAQPEEVPPVVVPPPKPRVPTYRTFRPFPMGARTMCTPRKRVLPRPAPTAPAPEPPRKKLLRRSQARKRTYLPTIEGFLAYTDDSEDEAPSTFEVGQSSQPAPYFPTYPIPRPASARPTRYTVRDMVGRHDIQIRGLRDQVQEIHDDLYLPGAT